MAREKTGQLGLSSDKPRFAAIAAIGCVLAGAACGGVASESEPIKMPPAAKHAETALLKRSCERAKPGVGPVREGDVRQGASVALAREGDTLLAYVADHDRKQIDVVDVKKQELRAAISVDGSPEQVLVLGDGRVVATIGDGTHIEVFEPTGDAATPLSLRCAREVPAGPFGLALSPDDATLAVTSAWDPALTVFDASDLTARGVQAVARSPRGVLIDGEHRAFVTHLVGANLSVVDLRKLEAAPRRVNMQVKAGSNVAQNLDLDLMRSGSQAYTLASVELTPGAAIQPTMSAPNGRPGGAIGKEAPPPLSGKLPKTPPKPNAPKLPIPTPAVDPPPVTPIPATPELPPKPSVRLIVPMVSVDPGDPQRPTQLYYGPPPTAGVAKQAPIAVVVDATTERNLSSRVIAPTRELRGEECLIPRAAAFDKSSSHLFIACLGIDQMLELDARSADPMRAVMRRFQLPKGPTGLALAQKERVAVVFSQFDASLAVVSLDDGPTTTIPLDRGNGPLDHNLIRGRDLFYQSNDTRITFDGVACSSCHPDGGDDGVSWSTPEGMRQTVMLAGRLTGTAPYGWTRQQGTLPEYISDTSRRLGGTGLSPDDLSALASYIKHLPGPPRRHASPLAEEGRKAFFDAGCDSCHAGGPGTDHTSHEAASEIGVKYDTPSLFSIGQTGPYFHDGRYQTLEELLGDRSSTMGTTSSLTPDQQRSIRAYLEAL